MSGAPAPAVLLVVSAASGAGKTTLLERLVPRLVAAGLRVAAVKRTHHDVDLDPPGKDSRRLRDAGAAPVVLRGPRVTTVFAPTPADGDETAPMVAAALAFGRIDLVLVEGGRRDTALPRIEVVPAGASAISDASLLVAVATDGGRGPGGVPCFARDDVDALASAVLTWVRASRPS